MATALKPKAERLVREFQTKLNLSVLDSRRAAFVVLATANGWRKTRIARYLGVSRARVGQRVDKYLQYAESGEWPAIGKALANPASPAPEKMARNGSHITFSKEDWESEDFANDLLNRLA